MSSDEQGLDKSRQRYQLVPRTLVFIFRDDSVLLLKGAPTKKIWANMYNGIGGHVEVNEDLAAAALREVDEETGLAVDTLRFCGTININAGDPTLGIGMFVFAADYRGGTPLDSREGTLEWVPLQHLENYALVSDLPVLLALIVNEPKTLPFFGRYWYADGALQIEINGQRYQPFR